MTLNQLFFFFVFVFGNEVQSYANLVYSLQTNIVKKEKTNFQENAELNEKENQKLLTHTKLLQ